jgi:hypothetical protein
MRYPTVTTQKICHDSTYARSWCSLAQCASLLGTHSARAVYCLQRLYATFSSTTAIKWYYSTPDQIPPDLVVKYQAIDIIEITFSLSWPWNIVQTPCRNRK